MDQLYWFALGAFSLTMTLLWLVVLPRRRVYFTAGMSALGWLMMAFTAPSLIRITETGSTVSTPPGTFLQLFVGLLGLLSLSVLVLFRLGEYPPPTDEVQP